MHRVIMNEEIYITAGIYEYVRIRLTYVYLFDKRKYTDCCTVVKKIAFWTCRH